MRVPMLACAVRRRMRGPPRAIAATGSAPHHRSIAPFTRAAWGASVVSWVVKQPRVGRTMPKRPYVSIGHVAKALGVQPDTVLGWIERGLLVGTRTEAGYFRIPREQLKELLRHRAASKANPQGTEHGCHGCGHCCAHREDAAESAPLVQISTKPRSQAKSPDGACKVLVVTDSADLRARLLGQISGSGLVLEFATQGYECSALVGRFQPEMVVVDCGLPLADVEELCGHLAADPRVPGLRMVLASSDARGCVKGSSSVVAELPRTFNLSDLETLMGSAALVETPSR